MINLKFLQVAAMLALLATGARVSADNPLSIAHEDATVHLSWPTSEGGYRLQASGSLATTDWQDVSTFYEASRFHAFEPIDQPRKFYRLVRDINPNGTITIGVMLFQFNALPFTALTFDEANSSLPDMYFYNAIFFNNHKLTFNASNAYNPRTGSSSGLTFHWTILYEDQNVPNPYRVAGITGYDTPELTILPNSLVQTVEPEIMTLVLIVSDPTNPDPDSRETIFRITGEVASSVTLAVYNSNNAPGAVVTNPNCVAVP